MTLIVRIVPAAYLRERNREAGGSGRLSPRLHWRRSHIRTLRSGNILTPRFLVGTAWMGEVTHGYRVTP